MTDHPDRHKILARVITDILVKRRTDGEGAGVSDQKGVAVRLGLGRRLGADGAAGTAAIVDDDALSEQLAHLVGDDARDDGGAASRRKRNDEGDGAVRPGLRLCMMDAADTAKHKSENAKRSAQAAHPTTPHDTLVVVRDGIVLESSKVRKASPARSSQSLLPGAAVSARPRGQARLSRETRNQSRTSFVDVLCRLFTGRERPGVRVSDIERSYRSCHGLRAVHNARHSSRTPTE